MFFKKCPQRLLVVGECWDGNGEVTPWGSLVCGGAAAVTVHTAGRVVMEIFAATSRTSSR